MANSKASDDIPECFRGLSLRQLSTLRVVDRLSCYVSGIQPTFASSETLSQPAWFGQFGGVVSVQLIQNSSPPEALIRFETEEATCAAISWANEKPALSAKHGYTKFCIKFLNRRRCKRERCHLRHSWCDQADVIEHKQTAAARAQSNPKASAAPKSGKSKGPRRQIGPLPHSRASPHPQQVLQQQFTHLQQQYTQQQNFIEGLLHQITFLKSQNHELRMENHVLCQYSQYSQYARGPLSQSGTSVSEHGSHGTPPSKALSYPPPPSQDYEDIMSILF